ncbi:MAG: hypothetical protein KF773_21100 [Deltaproteobacteria bacterium]|nr:hypothetical protein [Deltaproteobacteria bacterium]MCW5801709.1 hypothetical protein [Deltaproteobacteria bacterium]
MKRHLFALGLVAALSAPIPVAADAGDASALRETCTKAMNADPGFAKSIVIVAEKNYRKASYEQIERENKEIVANEQQQERFAKNERHVILAYAAMWVLAAGFLIMLWRRQQGLVAEIAQLHRDLAEATAEPAAPAKAPAKKPEKGETKPDPATKGDD